MPPVCASPSNMSAAGITGYPGRCSAKMSSARLRFLTALAVFFDSNSRNRSIQTQRICRVPGIGFRGSGSGPTEPDPRSPEPDSGIQLVVDIADDRLNGEQVANDLQRWVRFKLRQIGERHLGLEFGEPLRGDAAVFNKLGVALED